MANTGTAADVRQYLKKKGSGSSATIAKAVKRPRTAVYTAMRDLMKAGVIVKDPLMRGLYHFNRHVEPKPRRSADVQAKIWRAIKISKAFTKRDLVFYSGATLDYVKRYVSFLLSAGLVEKVSAKGKHVVFRVKPDAPHDAPRMKNTAGSKPTREPLEIAWELLKLLTANDMKAAREAHERLGLALKEKAA